jgi:hypothetical protein
MDFLSKDTSQRLHRALFCLMVELNEATRTVKAFSARARTAWHDGISAAIKRREARIRAFNG